MTRRLRFQRTKHEDNHSKEQATSTALSYLGLKSQDQGSITPHRRNGLRTKHAQLRRLLVWTWHGTCPCNRDDAPLDHSTIVEGHRGEDLRMGIGPTPRCLTIQQPAETCYNPSAFDSMLIEGLMTDGNVCDMDSKKCLETAVGMVVTQYLKVRYAWLAHVIVESSDARDGDCSPGKDEYLSLPYGR
nr:hypothetical protein CFP56_53657 [Quercus suber]